MDGKADEWDSMGSFIYTVIYALYSLEDLYDVTKSSQGFYITLLTHNEDDQKYTESYHKNIKYLWELLESVERRSAIQ